MDTKHFILPRDPQTHCMHGTPITDHCRECDIVTAEFLRVRSLRDSGEHDTLDDQIAYEQEHGTREYRLAEELHREMGHALTMMAFSNCATTRDVGRWHAKVQQLRDALAPRPPITPTGSIDDVPWTETDQ